MKEQYKNRYCHCVISLTPEEAASVHTLACPGKPEGCCSFPNGNSPYGDDWFKIKPEKLTEINQKSCNLFVRLYNYICKLRK